MLLVILLVSSVMVALLALRSVQKHKDVMKFERYLLSRVEVQHRKLDKDYRKLKDGLSQI